MTLEKYFKISNIIHKETVSVLYKISKFDLYKIFYIFLLKKIQISNTNIFLLVL